MKGMILMNEIDPRKVKYLTFKQVSDSTRVNRTKQTILSWYEELDIAIKEGHPIPDGCPGLPELYRDKPNGPFKFSEEDVDHLIAYRDWKPKGRNGAFAFYSEARWPDWKREQRQKRLEEKQKVVDTDN